MKSDSGVALTTIVNFFGKQPWFKVYIVIQSRPSNNTSFSQKASEPQEYCLKFCECHIASRRKKSS